MTEYGERRIDDMQYTLDLLCATIRSTRAGGTCNPLKEIRLLKDRTGTYAVPVFENGDGTPNAAHPHGYYAVDITCDSAVCAVYDVVRGFVKPVLMD